jgi:hypothetical protein
MSPSKKEIINASDKVVPASPVEAVTPEKVPPPLPPFQAPSPLPSNSSKPGKVQAIAIMTLVSGIMNILWMIGWAFGILAFGISTFGLGCLLIFLVVPPLVLGVFEIVYAAKLLPTSARPVAPSQTIAILEIICILTGNPFALVAGILALVFYSEPDVKAYFIQLNQLA